MSYAGEYNFLTENLKVALKGLTALNKIQLNNLNILMEMLKNTSDSQWSDVKFKVGVF